MQCSMAWALHRTEKEKPAAGKTDYWRDFWRSGWDSNPRNLAVQLISSQSRYDHFDTAPYLSQHQHLGKRGELMGRTSKNIKLRIPEKPHKIKGFRSGSYRVATTISSRSRYDHFDTAPCINFDFRPSIFGETFRREPVLSAPPTNPGNIDFTAFFDCELPFETADFESFSL